MRRPSKLAQYQVGSLFAGMGGFCLAFAKEDFKVTWANEKDRFAVETYRHNFPKTAVHHKPIEDLSVIGDDLSPVDVLTAGFPCQPFSVAGSKLGFHDERGKAFFEIMRLISEFGKDRPKILLFENVPHLMSHDRGHTFNRIAHEIQAAGYWFMPRENTTVLNTKIHTSIPQNRERLYMVALSWDHFRTNTFNFPKPEAETLDYRTFLDLEQKPDDSFYFNDDSRWKKLFEDSIDAGDAESIYMLRRNYVRENKSNSVFALMANMGDGGHNVPVIRDNWGIRKLTPPECLRLQGFEDDHFSFPELLSKVQQYKQIGNAVTVPLVGNYIVDESSYLLYSWFMKAPRTLQEAILYFADADNCIRYMVEHRWANGVICPTCGRKDVSWLANQRKWQCKSAHSKRQFSAKVGTIFEDSALGLEKWLPAVWIIVSAKNGVSSCEIARTLGVTQKTAWFMLHRIRLAMQSGSLMKVGGNGGEVEADETFIGGKARNMHLSVRQRRITGTGTKDKVAVMGILERGGEVRTIVVPNRRKHALQAEVRKHVEAGAALYTDFLLSYEGLASDYAHKVVDHAVEYVNGRVHTNGLENFWSLLKRGINGTYVSVEPFHLFRYLDEQTFRYNNRKNMSDADRFSAALSQVVGRRLTYAEVTGKVGETTVS